MTSVEVYPEKLFFPSALFAVMVRSMMVIYKKVPIGKNLSKIGYRKVY